MALDFHIYRNYYYFDYLYKPFVYTSPAPAHPPTRRLYKHKWRIPARPPRLYVISATFTFDIS